MKKFKRVFSWFLLLNKRLLKKTSYIAILCLIPLLALALSIAADEDSGMLTVVLCSESDNDSVVNDIIEKLSAEEGVINYYVAASVDEAYDHVKYGKADSAWIFKEDFEKAADDYVSGKGFREPLVKVIEKEDNISLKLSHEKLFSSIFSEVSYSLFKNFLLTQVFDVDEITIDEIKKGYDDAIGGGDIFVSEKLDGSKKQRTDYLLSPLRGLLATVAVLCGMAAVMYHQLDIKNGVYDRLPASSHIYPCFASCAAAVLDSVIAINAALAVLGVFTGIFREVISSLLFVLAVTAFCSFVGSLTESPSLTGQILPFVMIALVAFTPIFFDLSELKVIQLLFPAYYYMNAVYNGTYLIYMMGYTLFFIFSALLVNKLKHSK